MRKEKRRIPGWSQESSRGRVTHKVFCGRRRKNATCPPSPLLGDRRRQPMVVVRVRSIAATTAGSGIFISSNSIDKSTIGDDQVYIYSLVKRNEMKRRWMGSHSDSHRHGWITGVGWFGGELKRDRGRAWPWQSYVSLMRREASAKLQHARRRGEHTTHTTAHVRQQQTGPFVLTRRRKHHHPVLCIFFSFLLLIALKDLWTHCRRQLAFECFKASQAASSSVARRRR